MGGLVTPILNTPLVIGQGVIPLNDMKAIYKGKTRKNPNVKIYILDCTDAEKAEYKKVKGTENYVEDEVTGKALYFTQRALSSEIDYKLVDGSLVTESETKVQATLNLLAKYDGMSLEDLQKANQIKSLEAGF
jgi:hypothetical protein